MKTFSLEAETPQTLQLYWPPPVPGVPAPGEAEFDDLDFADSLSSCFLMRSISIGVEGCTIILTVWSAPDPPGLNRGWTMGRCFCGGSFFFDAGESVAFRLRPPAARKMRRNVD